MWIWTRIVGRVLMNLGLVVFAVGAVKEIVDTASDIATALKADDVPAEGAVRLRVSAPEAEHVLRLAGWAEVDVLGDPSTGPLPDPQPSEGAGAATVQDVSPEDVVESFGAVLE